MFHTNHLMTAALLCATAFQAPLMAADQDARSAAIEVEMHLQLPGTMGDNGAMGDNGVLHVHVIDGFAAEAEGARHVLAFGPSLEQSVFVFLAMEEGENARVSVPADLIKDLAGLKDAGYRLQVFRIHGEEPLQASDPMALAELKIQDPQEPSGGAGTDPDGQSGSGGGSPAGGNPAGGNSDDQNGLPVDTKE